MLSAREETWLTEFAASCRNGEVSPALHPVPPRIQGMLHAIGSLSSGLTFPALPSFREIAKEMKDAMREREPWEKPDDDQADGPA